MTEKKKINKNSKIYTPEKNKAVSPNNYINYEQQYKNIGHVFILEALHIKDSWGNPDSVMLFPYLESISENYNSNWNKQTVYGRMDGIYNFQDVGRSITLTLKVAAANYQQAKENQYKLSKLIRFLYPAVQKQVYKLDENQSYSTNIIRSAPILRLKFGNIICDTKTNQGAYGIINGGFNITPLHEHGWFSPVTDPDSEKRDASDNETTFLYKYFDINFTFTVLHNHILGNDSDDKDSQTRFFSEYFPYGLNKTDFKIGSELNVPGSKYQLDKWRESLGSVMQDAVAEMVLNQTAIGNQIGAEYGERFEPIDHTDPLYEEKRKQFETDMLNNRLFGIAIKGMFGGK